MKQECLWCVIGRLVCDGLLMLKGRRRRWEGEGGGGGGGEG